MSISVITISDDQVEMLLQTQEGHFVDLNAIEITPANASKTVSAFANSSGGEMFIGVDELLGDSGVERNWRGFANEEAANGLIQTLEAMSPLGNHYTVEFLRNDHRSGLVTHITVFKAKEILVASNGKVFVRRGAQKLPVEGEEAMRRLKFDKGLVSFEDELVDLPCEELSNSVTMPLLKFEWVS